MRPISCLLAAFALAASFAHAQTAASPETLLTPGVWRLEVQDRNPHRELEVTRVRPGADGKASVRARYGWWGANLGRLPVTLDVSQPQPRLEFTTKAKSQVTLQRVDETTYEGTMVNARGRSFPAKLKLVSTQDSGDEPVAAAEAAEESPPPTPRHGGKTTYPRDAKIQFVYMGGNDCPPCREWRATEFRKLEAAPEFAQMRFYYVVKSVPSPVPVGWLPDEVKALGPALLDASLRRR